MKQALLTLTLLTISLTPFSQGLSNDTLHWSAHRALQWEDFKGYPVDGPGAPGRAMIVMHANSQQTQVFFPSNATVATVFDRKNSRAAVAGRTEQALKYHQTGFDLYEVYTRRLRQVLKQTDFGTDGHRVFQEKYNAALRELNDRNKLFMKETNQGQDSNALNRWEATIKKELRDLNAYGQMK